MDNVWSPLIFTLDGGFKVMIFKEFCSKTKLLHFHAATDHLEYQEYEILLNAWKPRQAYYNIK